MLKFNSAARRVLLNRLQQPELQSIFQQASQALTANDLLPSSRAETAKNEASPETTSRQPQEDFANAEWNSWLASLSAQQQNPQEIHLQVLASLIDHQPPVLLHFLRLCAIPAAFDRSLVERLVEGFPAPGHSSASAEELFARLGGLSFSRRDSWGRLVFDLDARRLLLERLQQPDLQPLFRQVNQALLDEAQHQVAHGPAALSLRSQRDLLNHLLLADALSGLNYLFQAFQLACDQRQLGHAQDLLQRLRDLLAFLPPDYLTWHDFYALRLSGYTGRLTPGALALQFQRLAKNTSSGILQAMALWQAGDWARQDNQWTAALASLQNSLQLLRRANRPTEAARVCMAIGSVYLDLAENNGELQGGPLLPETASERWLYYLVHFPFILLEWLRRWTPFFPAFLIFSSRYQDWLLNYLLLEAGVWFAKAQSDFEKLSDSSGLLEALRLRTETALSLKRWASASALLQRLRARPEVQSSRYRYALYLLGQAEIDMVRRQHQAALASLHEAAQTFDVTEDAPQQARASRLLGRLLLRQGKVEEAGQAYLSAARAYQQAGDPLGRSQALGEALDSLVRRGHARSSSAREGSYARLAMAFEDFGAFIKEKTSPLRPAGAPNEPIDSASQVYFLAGFPDHLLRTFRRVAYLFALPAGYLFTLGVGIAATLSLAVLENWLLRNTDQIPPSQGAVLAAVVILALPVALWGYRFAYCVLGLIVAGWLSKKVKPLEEQQPDLLIASPHGLEVRRNLPPGAIATSISRTPDAQEAAEGDGRTIFGGAPGPGQPSNQPDAQVNSVFIPWEEILALGPADVRVWRQPISLASRLHMLFAHTLEKPTTQVIEGITIGYAHLARLVRSRIKPNTPSLDGSFTLLASMSALAAAALSLFCAWWMVIHNLINLRVQNIFSGGQVYLFYTPLVAMWLFSLMIFFPPFALWQLYFQRRRMSRFFPPAERPDSSAPANTAPSVVPSAVLASAAVFSTLLALAWLVLILILAA